MLESTPSSGNSLKYVSALTVMTARKALNLRKGNFETLLDLLENVLIIFAGNEGDAETLGAETTGATDSVKVRVRVGGEIVVDGQVDTFDIDATAKHVSSHADSLVKLLEFLIALDTIAC